MTSFSTQLQAASAHLSDNDPQLSSIIARYGACTISPHTNYYEELVSSIISQQLSVKAAATIWSRFYCIIWRYNPYASANYRNRHRRNT